MNTEILHKNGTKKEKIDIHPQNDNTPTPIKSSQNCKSQTSWCKLGWILNCVSWVFNVCVKIITWFWKRPLKMIASIVVAIIVWMLSFFHISLPSLPFLPKPPISQKQNETPKKSEETQKQDNRNNNPSSNDGNPTNSVASNDDKKVSTQYVTNTVTQTNIVSQTNYVTETKYVTNFVVQPIVVTNTVYKEVPITVTNVLVIKNNVSNSDTNNGGNKNSVITGPAFYFTDDFNTLLQNQQQNPIRNK